VDTKFNVTALIHVQNQTNKTITRLTGFTEFFWKISGRFDAKDSAPFDRPVNFIPDTQNVTGPNLLEVKRPFKPPWTLKKCTVTLLSFQHT
jgi:hypothetical protein